MHALIVDDSTTMRMVLKAQLKMLGCEATEAVNGLDALVQLRGMLEVDVVLVDWNMPEMDGLSFVRAVRADLSFELLPLVMVTTNNDVAHVSLALEAGANEYLMKPFTIAMVREKLEMLGFLGT